ncbi:type III-B CRISPR module RAMP protein Cmr4 [Clostridium brassicae]|uniref:Type III-B CRISPR module RAMP protein Cmr4 n=1 Tax=Clostridium brassicae TaxID=2999072 RepID=A0ABT4DB53_9CLOT|nr:type III-B CRISPR module RAMP protein Cmr4 [Clostridium brassicae]MCY6958366.1 type III-B CRISPR module RAMP protein Cmr4 [Clostridium brassicae]
MDNFKLYIIENITNMHVGNGDINFNIIDNEVQRDVITEFPTINPSSLKGSLRAFCGENLKKQLNEDEIKHIFGDKKTGIGRYKFLGASLLSMPVRSDVKPFFRAICPLIIKEFINILNDFKIQIELEKDVELGKNLEEILLQLEDLFKEENNQTDEEQIGFLLSDIDVNSAKVEGYKVIKAEDNVMKISKNLEKIFGEDLVIFNDKIFKQIVKELPVIARNKLEIGVSKNLWYEEVVPRETRFYFGVIESSEDRECIKNLNKRFNKLIKNNIVQFGANATIGYGYCKIYELGDKNE